ncbi:hypothetical protein GF342_03015 [Candidatus Woesearchaeota archaeon]|nr:hypothetical protein [Candidatus Woesearchaeota archaeon]
MSEARSLQQVLTFRENVRRNLLRRARAVFKENNDCHDYFADITIGRRATPEEIEKIVDEMEMANPIYCLGGHVVFGELETTRVSISEARSQTTSRYVAAVHPYFPPQKDFVINTAPDEELEHISLGTYDHAAWEREYLSRKAQRRALQRVQG